jgi:DNA-binding MarR family transcriptional regulator
MTTGPRRRKEPADKRDALVDAMIDVLPGLVGVATRSIAAVDGDVTVPQYRALAILAVTGSQNLGTLSERLQVHPSTATRLCDRLVAKGLVLRRAGRNDRREVSLELTRRGRRTVEQVTALRRQEFEKMLARIPTSQRRSLRVALARLAAVFGETDDGSSFGDRASTIVSGS